MATQPTQAEVLNGEAKKTKLMKREEAALAPPVSVTPMDLLRTAVDKDFDIDKLEKLLALQERWEATEAKKAFDAAMVAFKADLPEILKNKKASFGSGDRAVGYEYVSLDHLCDALIPALAKHGLTHRWEVEQANEHLIRVTCILSKGIHSERCTMAAAPDQSGAKNAIQAAGSATTYLQKYTLTAICGVAAKGMDTDGAVQDENLDGVLKAIKDAPDTSALDQIWKAAFNDAKGNVKAQLVIVNAKNDRLKEIKTQAGAR